MENTLLEQLVAQQQMQHLNELAMRKAIYYAGVAHHDAPAKNEGVQAVEKVGGRDKRLLLL